MPRKECLLEICKQNNVQSSPKAEKSAHTSDQERECSQMGEIAMQLPCAPEVRTLCFHTTDTAKG